MMIRSATQKDIEQLVPLIMIVLDDMELEMLSVIDRPKLLEIMTELVAHPTYRYSYKRALVYEDNNQIIGVAYSYSHSDEEIIDLPLDTIVAKHGYTGIKLFIEPETKEDEWYLDTIATHAVARGKGVGSALIQAVINQARALGYSKVGLNVDLANPKAKKLYQKLGFHYVDQLMIGTHTYEHLQKNI